MTVKEKGGAISRIKSFLPISEILILLTAAVMLTMPNAISVGVKSGLLLCAGTILPSVFPFMVIGDFISCYVSANGLRILERTLARRLGISRGELSVLVCGILCGFPSAARATAISPPHSAEQKERAIQICALSSTPSPPFIIGAVGAGLFGSEMVGLLLLISLLISVRIGFAIFVSERQENSFSDVMPRQKYSFVSSVRSAGVAAVTVFAFVALFGALVEIIKIFVKFSTARALIFPFLEVGAAMVYLSSVANIPRILLYFLVGFSLGFGGACANLQCASFLADAGFRLKKFFIIKLALGTICGLITPTVLVISDFLLAI